LRHPLAVDISVFDLALERVPVVELEVPDFGVVGVFEEDWLAMSSVLNDTLAFRLVNVHGYITNVLYQWPPSKPLGPQASQHLGHQKTSSPLRHPPSSEGGAQCWFL
jgi:hypothetical protein